MTPKKRHDRLEAANRPADEALRLHAHYRGKVQTMLKCAVRSFDDFAIWYTPGVAAPCRAIAEDAEQVYRYTNKGNTIAIVSNGTRVLGLGNIGPQAGLPVMEGKALLFKYLGGIDAVPLCIDARSAEEVIQAVRLIQPSYGGINLEDISQPDCFQILDALRGDSDVRIPVFHDDQQGTATVLLAGLINALKITGREMENARFAMIGMGAANVATLRLLRASGVGMDQIVATDSKGILGPWRDDVAQAREQYPDKWRLCQESNPEGRRAGSAEAMRNADVCIAFATPGPGIIKPAWVAAMAESPIVFACSNPVPEIWPWEAYEAGAAIVGTGRSDFANQLNNSLGFPGIFRGALDVRATTITDEMCLAAAHRLAQIGEERGLDPERIVPDMDCPDLYAHEAVAVALKAQEQGLAQRDLAEAELFQMARERISAARRLVEEAMQNGTIGPVPTGE